MRCVQMTATGGPEVLQPAECPQPEPGAGQVRVRLAAAGINPVDTKIRHNGLFDPSAALPAILGCDGAGTVEAAGSGVDGLEPGDRVLFLNGGIGLEPGNYAEQAVVDARFVAALPEAVDLASAAATPLAAITAWEGLFDRGRLEAGERVLVHAGAGGVGHLAVQLARSAGAHVITTVSDDAKERFVRGLGADEVIRYRERDFAEAARACTGGRGVDLVLDTVGGETCARSVHALATYGRLVTILALPAEEVDWKHARLHNLAVTQELMLSPMVLDRDDLRIHQRSVLEACARRLADGTLRTHVAQRFPLEEAAQAHRTLEAGGTVGKLVLEIGG